MKTIAIFLFLATTHFCFAQAPELLDNDWYLQNVIIDGNDNPPPSNDEVNEVIAEFFVDSFGTLVCNNLVGLVAYNNQNFNFTKPLEQTLLPCNMQVNQDFEVLYFSFYYSNQTEPFSYLITTEGNGSKTLTVTSASGDEAVYGNEMLSNADISKQLFSIYPNPAKEKLFIQLENGGDFKIKVYGLDGKLLLSESGLNKKTVAIETLSPGVYFALLETETGQVETKKFIKE